MNIDTPTVSNLSLVVYGSNGITSRRQSRKVVDFNIPGPHVLVSGPQNVDCSNFVRLHLGAIGHPFRRQRSSRGLQRDVLWGTGQREVQSSRLCANSVSGFNRFIIGLPRCCP
jgi:hypothetical protein